MTTSTPHSTAPAPRSLRERLQPLTVTGTVRIAAWLMLLAQSGIILTGALVRLTGSGLGCPTWPKCTPESLTNTPEMGIHGYIEFGNRLLGVALGVLCLVTVLHLWRLRKDRKDLFVLAVSLLAVVPAQAVIGGITVLTDLNPWSVAIHFIPSAFAVAASAYFVRRTHDSGRLTGDRAPQKLRILAWVIAVLVLVVVLFGVLTTGAGPHSGDELSTRNGLDPEIMARLHAWPVWALVIATVVARVLAARAVAAGTADRALSRTLDVLIGVEILQGVIGYVQHFTGLPVTLVALHMIGVCLVIAAATAVVDACYSRAPLPEAPARS